MKNYLSVFLEQAGPDDQVEGAGLILQGDKADAAGGAGALADEDEAGDLDVLPVALGAVVPGRKVAQETKVFAEEADGMGF